MRWEGDSDNVIMMISRVRSGRRVERKAHYKGQKARQRIRCNMTWEETD